MAIVGTPLLESIDETSRAIESRGWADGVRDAGGAALAALGTAVDPFGPVLAGDVGWLLEHCGLLSEALDVLTGDPAEIRAHAETWQHVGTELSAIDADLTKMITDESWPGPAGDAFRARYADTATLLSAARTAAEGAASGISSAGEVVGAVRTQVRDIITDLVGHLLRWALHTPGIGLVWVASQVATAVAKTAARIAGIIKKLVRALGKLSPLLQKLGDSFGEATQALRNTKPARTKPGRPGDRAIPVRDCEPVDVATGQVVLRQADLTLIGTPDLVLERTHLSAYREGRWFGPSWASTLDQRLEADEAHLRYFSADGMVLFYPYPTGPEEVLPLLGPRYPLRRTGDGYRVTDPATGRTLLFEPETQRLVTIEHPGSPTVTLEYDGDAPSVLRRSDGYEVRFITAEGRITGIDVLSDDHTVPVVRFGYNKLGQLTEVANAAGPPMALDYDLSDRLAGWRDRTGTWFRYAYDTEGRCVRTVGADGFRNGAYSYERERRATRYTDSLGHTTEYRFDEAGRLVEEIDPLGGRRGFTWDQQGRLLSRTDALGRTTLFTYGEDGLLAGVVRPDGSVVGYSRDAGGALLTMSTKDGVVRRRVPDVDPLTEPVGVASPSHPARPAGLFADADPEAAQPGERDAFGRPRKIRTASDATVGLGWTVAGHRAVRQGPLGRRDVWRFDAEGHAIEHRSASGQVTRRRYGRFGLLAEEIDAAGGRTTFRYDGELRLIEVTNAAGLAWRYTYDPVGRLIEEEDCDGRLLSFDYNAAGQLTSTTNGLGEVTAYRYDPLGNVVERRTAGDVTTYAYDPLGRLVRAAGREAVLEISRDVRGRVLAESVNGHTVRWSYEGAAVHRRTPSGVDSSWHRDEHGRPDRLLIAGHEVDFERDPAGREVARFVDGHRVLCQEFDAEDLLTTQVLSDRVLKRDYTYRIDGQLIAIDDSATGATRFQLDPLGRVTELTAPHGTERYGYDAAGNITRDALGIRGYHHNLLAEAGGVTYTADRQGRITGRRAGDREWTFTWDRLDRLTGLTTPDGTRWTYHYDPVGRRFAKRRWPPGGELAEEIRFAWDGTEIVEQETRHADGSRSVITWEHCDGRPVVQLDARLRVIVTNSAGTPTELLDSDGSLRWQASTGLCGNDLGAATGTPLRFPGQYQDAESGLHYGVHRYYDPETARYLSQDPLGLRSSPNPMGYVANPYLFATPAGVPGVPERPGVVDLVWPEPDEPA
ncbi:DUF6531 domain-containing protein [Amycolatopsis magusensis]|uniref:RHS repeat-associated protein n=1 Tax=Amycolatopsis magusensis TaxID=882444 RepID=A0ABS4PRV5_9PSEU|nr:DUF6531 domain-containing protein [Amycolatopsis magusensis]MBP2182145.1 RHS repeat-associated protein [Amycolatopsis magusensis]